MIDPEVKSYLERFDQRLQAIQYKKQGLWRSFFTGMMSALGYIAGLALVLVIFGWILQKIGLWQAFTQQIQNFNDVINQTKKLTEPSGQQQGRISTATLPDGRQVQITLPPGY